MKHPIAVAVLALCALHTAQAQGPAQTGMKPGLWESRTTKMVMDGKDALPQMTAAREQMRQQLAKMPPEQRKKMEPMLGAQGDPLAQRLCVSPEMARQQQAMLPRPARADCAEPKLTRDGNRTAFEFSCKQGQGTVTGKGETVVTGEQVSVKVDTISTEPGGTKHSMQAETQMRFIGSDCGGLKPLDQLARQAQASAASQPGPRQTTPQK